MKTKQIVLLIAPFLIMFGVTIGAGRYAAMVAKTEGHGAKGVIGFDIVLIVSFLIRQVRIQKKEDRGVNFLVEQGSIWGIEEK